MKIASFRIINCFGFRDSGEINLIDSKNLILILGRNSSGKSSLLNTISYFEVENNLADKPNFKNFNDSGIEPSLNATFIREDTTVSFETFWKRAVAELSKLRITTAAL